MKRIYFCLDTEAYRRVIEQEPNCFCSPNWLGTERAILDGKDVIVTTSIAHMTKEVMEGWDYEMWLCAGRSGELVQRKVEKSMLRDFAPPKVTTAGDIISLLRKEVDKVYEAYEGNPLIEKDGIMDAFEGIINDYYAV